MFKSLKEAIGYSFEQVEDYSETKFTETLLEWYPDSGTVMEVLELIDNESSKLSKGKISILYEIPFHTYTFCHLISIFTYFGTTFDFT